MYAKLFSSLYQGTLRGKSHEILVFTNLLAHCDKEGFVDKHFRAIAEETGLTQDEVRLAILELEAPDAESRSPEMDGRRIVPIDEHRNWGWQVVNYGKYRVIKDEETRRETWRKSQEKRRKCQHLSTSVNICQPPSTHIEVEGDANVDTKPSRSIGVAALANAIYEAYPRKVGRKAAISKITAALASHSAEAIMDATKAYATATAAWPDDERQFIPHPATWFSQDRFLDDRATWERKGSKPKQQPAKPDERVPEPEAWRERWGMIDGNFPMPETQKWGNFTPKEQRRYADAIASIPIPQP